MPDFTLHERLNADTYFIADLKLCRLLLMNDTRFPWVILVPRQNELREFHDLTSQDRHRLMDEISYMAQTIEIEFKTEKINIGALGNIVPQLHIHVIARDPNDAAWPAPVWGHGRAVSYTATDAQAQCKRIKALIQKF